MPTDEEPDCDDADPASLQMMTPDHYIIDSEGEFQIFKLMKGKNGATPFLPSKRKDRWKGQLHPKQRDHVLD